MRRFLPALLIAASLLFSGTLSAQLSFPDIPYDATEPLRLPPDIHLGEAAGVATNSKGDVFVYTRTGTPRITIAGARNVSHGGSRLFQFDRNGRYTREIGKDLSVYLDLGRFQSEDELAVRESVYPGGGIYAGNPECAEITLFDPPVPECVIQGAIDCFGSASEQFTSGSPVTLGQLQHLVSSLSRFKSSFYAWHFLLLCSGYLPDPQGETFPHGSRASKWARGVGRCAPGKTFLPFLAPRACCLVPGLFTYRV